MRLVANNDCLVIRELARFESHHSCQKHYSSMSYIILSIQNLLRKYFPFQQVMPTLEIRFTPPPHPNFNDIWTSIYEFKIYIGRKC